MKALDIRNSLDSARSRAERAEIADRLASKLGLSRATVLRKARMAGGRANRVRSDAGQTEIRPAHLELLAGIVAETQRQNHKIVAPVAGAVDMLEANGSIPAGIAHSTWCRALRASQVSKREIAAKPAWRSRKCLPGEVFMIDSSTCLYWRFPKGSSQRAAELDATTQMRMHKPEIMATLADQIKRYFVIDHASGYAEGRYVWTRGETPVDTIHALLHAFGRMGVPRHVYFDRGPGNIAFETRYLLWLLDVNIITKKGKDEWTMGRIDSVHNSVQQGLEWRFAFAKPDNIDEMNGLLDAWLHKRNAVSVHRAAKRTRQQMILDAEAGVVRRLPDSSEFLDAVVKRPETRNIDGRGCFQFNGKLWRVDDPTVINSKQYISVNPFAPDRLLVLKNFSLDSLHCDARIDAVLDPVNEFGQPASAIPLIGDHPVSAKKQPFAGDIAAARRAARQIVPDIDPYADLREQPIAASGKRLSEARMAKALADAKPVGTDHAERTYSPTAAIYRVIDALKRRGLDLDDADAALLAEWHERPAVPSSEIEAFVARAVAVPEDSAVEEAV